MLSPSAWEDESTPAQRRHRNEYMATVLQQNSADLSVRTDGWFGGQGASSSSNPTCTTVIIYPDYTLYRGVSTYIFVLSFHSEKWDFYILK